ncbi:MAG: hypothetical protein HY760_04695, partial [Nitrospirae bacterium]|nr:hypothetical protein [Nitrospirota bacterium]
MKNMETTLFFTFVSSLIVSLVLIPLLMKWAGRFNALDLPGDRKLHSEPIARVGGIGFAAGTIA